MKKVLQEAVVNFARINRKTNGTPACFSDVDYIQWIAAESAARTLPIGGFVCRDCTRGYQLEMIREGKCCQPMELDVGIISGEG